MSQIVGIDLGTTNSLVAVLAGDRPVVIPNRLGSRLTPSVVRFFADGHQVTGEPARRARSEDPRHTVGGIKRFIGRYYNEVADLAELAPYRVVPGPNDEATIRLHGRDWSPEEISSLVLRDLKNSAEAYLGEKVDRAVVTIPAHFNGAQRRSTAKAVELAGLSLERLLQEPTAAALAYGYRKEEDRDLLVLDLGGGTYDVSLLEVGEGVVEVKAIDGDSDLGGDDFDEALLTWACEEIWRRHGFDLMSDPEAAQRIREEVAAAKRTLSELASCTLKVPFLFRRQGVAVSVDLVLSRDDFNAYCDELFERLVPPVERALRSAHRSPSDVGEVLLVGGATRMCRVRDIVRRLFGRQPRHGIEAEEAVALGAAIQGGVLVGGVKDTLLLDVLPYDISIETGQGTAAMLTDRDMTVPFRKTEMFTTQADNQTSVEINILTGGSPFAEHNRLLGRLVFDGIPALPRGRARIEVAVEVDANRDLHVTANDLGTGRSESLTLRYG